MDGLVQALKAAGEPTRLRILVVLERDELTVGELCRVLGQSQPRVSRHLKLLVDAGLLERHAEGASAFFRPCLGGRGQRLYDIVIDLADTDEAVMVADRARLEEVRAARAGAAAAYFEALAPDWDRIRADLVADETVEAALLRALGSAPIETLLDVGTGTGRILEIAAPLIGRGIGVDRSREMLHIARSRLEQRGFGHCSVRHGNVYDLDIASATMDVAVLHHVLHFLDRPATAVGEVARTLRPGGRLLIVDYARHEVERLRTDYAHHRLGFADGEVMTFCSDAGLELEPVMHFTPQHAAIAGPADGPEPLTVTLWGAHRTEIAPSVGHNLEAIS